MKRAFTLIEIMIVIAIIGMIAAIAIPNFVKSRSTANRQTCISNLHQIELVTQQWAYETRQKEDAPVTANDILPYLKGDIRCPSGGKTFSDSYSLTTVQNPPACLIMPKTHKPPETTL